MANASLLGSGFGCAPAPSWVSYPATFSDHECALIVSLMALGGDKDAGLVDGKATHSIRQSSIHWLAENEETAWIYERLSSLIARANREIFHFSLSGFDEDAQIGRYENGGFYDWHIDRGGRGLGRNRKLTVAVQLSPPQAYVGGALELNPDGHQIEAPRAIGTAVLFPAYVLHRVAPVQEGVRHSLVLWTHGPDFT